MSLDLKHAEARFSPNATDSLYLLVAQVPRPRDMASFVLTTTMTRPITLPLAHARGVITTFFKYILYLALSLLSLCSVLFCACISSYFSKRFHYLYHISHSYFLVTVCCKASLNPIICHNLPVYISKNNSAFL